MKLSALLRSVTQVIVSVDGGARYPLRPQTAENTFIVPRIKAAWRVLLGKSDAIEWDYPTEFQGLQVAEIAAKLKEQGNG